MAPPQFSPGGTGDLYDTPIIKNKRKSNKSRSKKKDKRRKTLNERNLQSDSDVVEISASSKKHIIKDEPDNGHQDDEVVEIKKEATGAPDATSASFYERKQALMQSIFKDCTPATKQRYSNTTPNSIKSPVPDQIIIEDDTPDTGDDALDLKTKHPRSRPLIFHGGKSTPKIKKEKRKSANFTIEIPPVREGSFELALQSQSLAKADKKYSPIEINSSDGSWHEARPAKRARNSRKQVSEAVIETIEPEAAPPARSPTIHRFSSFDVSPPTLLSPNTQNAALQESVRRGTEYSDWEYDLGKVRGRVPSQRHNEDAEVEENVAFSSQYIAERPNGVKLDDFTFQVRELKEGLNFQLPEIQQETCVRICSVATGRVQVQLSAAKFNIGANGMWRVRSDEGCIISNCGSGTAAVHITTIDLCGRPPIGDDMDENGLM
ncbi:hypothetical protein F5884DRAFT_755387 [Xylogone sp. PMI_703]|nr:hypothetical protein F5884DRAFT_755387 [Xylogone sp. PMI_703]